MDSAERIVETIQEIKEKIPSDPFEAELILMAEMVAEEEEKNDKQKRTKEKVVEKERQEAPATFGKRNRNNGFIKLDIQSRVLLQSVSKDEGKTRF